MKPHYPLLSLALMLVIAPTASATPQGGTTRYMFCADGGARRLAVLILPQTTDIWNVILTTNGRNEPARTAPNLFGSLPPRDGLVYSILPKAGTPPILIFEDHAEWSGRFYGPCP